MKDKKTYIILIISILIAVLGISYAFFSLNVIGNDTAKNNRIVTGNLELTFTDTSEISLNNIVPGDSIDKVIKVSNTGSKEVSYNIGWNNYENGIINNELVIEGVCEVVDEYDNVIDDCNPISKKAITGSNIISNIPIEPEVIHRYTLKITFIDTGKPQNYNKNKTFSGKLNITESTAKTVYCTFNGTLTQGAEYVNGEYTYRYKQEGKYSSSGLAWSDISTDGWGVQLTDKTSTEPVTSKLCTYINNKPIISMSLMFYNSQTTTLDLSNFNTSKVTNMNGMFLESKVTTLDLSSFDTSNINNMGDMFYKSQVLILDLSSFDTSNVTNMETMFYGSEVTTLDLSSFDTSKVINMNGMFCDCKVTTLDLSSFDTSNVTNMKGMFSGSQTSSLNLGNFDTSNVIDMAVMFSGSEVTTLNLSSFDTSNTKFMYGMFENAKYLSMIYVSDKYVIDNVIESSDMFANCTSLVGGAGTAYDSTKTDATYARIDGGTSSPGYFTGLTQFSKDDWSTIVQNVKSGKTNQYKVGETKQVDVGKFGIHTLRIANNSTPSECNDSNFSQTACGFVLEFTDSVFQSSMNRTATNVGGWPVSELYAYMNDVMYNNLPNDLKSGIINTKVISNNGISNANNVISNDKFYLPVLSEIYNDWSEIEIDPTISITRQLDYYSKTNTSRDDGTNAIKKENGKAIDWWMRLAEPTVDSAFFIIDSKGNLNAQEADTEAGVFPMFRLG